MQWWQSSLVLGTPTRNPSSCTRCDGSFQSPHGVVHASVALVRQVANSVCIVCWPASRPVGFLALVLAMSHMFAFKPGHLYCHVRSVGTVSVPLCMPSGIIYAYMLFCVIKHGQLSVDICHYVICICCELSFELSFETRELLSIVIYAPVH